MEPEICDLNGSNDYTVILPPPVAQQNELEKQRRRLDFDEILNYLTDCSVWLIRAVSGTRRFAIAGAAFLVIVRSGVTLNAMAYMRVSGEAAASVNVIGHLLGSRPLINLFAKTQVYAIPKDYVNGLNMADAVIKSAKSKIQKKPCKPF